MSDKTEALKDTLIKENEKVLAKEGVKGYFDGNKIILTVSVDGVKGKVSAPPAPRVKKPSRLSEEEQNRIKEVKKRFKERADVIYLFTLLMSLSSELTKAYVDGLDEESREVLIPAMNEVGKSLTKLLEVKK